MAKYDFNKVAFQLPPVNLLHIFTTPFLQKTTGRLLLHMQYKSAIARPSWFKSIRS